MGAVVMCPTLHQHTLIIIKMKIQKKKRKKTPTGDLRIHGTGAGRLFALRNRRGAKAAHCPQWLGWGWGWLLQLAAVPRALHVNCANAPSLSSARAWDLKSSGGGFTGHISQKVL